MTKKEEEKEKVLQDLLALDYNNLCLEFATGTGKSRCALEYVHHMNCTNILLVVPYTALISNWEGEIRKWGFDGILNVTIICYRSLSKCVGSNFDAIIFDECHHINKNNKVFIEQIKVNVRLFLSATIKDNLRNYLSWKFRITVKRIDIHDAIEAEILPDPKIYLIPLELNKTDLTEEVIINPKCENDYNGKLYMNSYWNCKKNRSYRFHITCTQFQKDNALSGEINSMKSKMDADRDAGIPINAGYRNYYRLKCLERLKWLSQAREKHTLKIVDALKYYRTITFCNSVQQTEIMGKNAIHHKVGKKKVAQLIEDFNNKKIKHITSVQMLNEGMNLTDCKFGIFAFYNSGSGIQVQKVGRILRHDNPVLVLPYFKGTREEEVVNDMIYGYNPDNIITITINELDKLKQLTYV